MRRLLVPLACALVCAAPSAARAASAAGATTTTTTAESEQPTLVARSHVVLVGRHHSSVEVLAIAERLPKMRQLVKENRGAFADAYLKGALRWQVSFFDRSGKKEIGLVMIADLTGRVIEQWTGYQVAWAMARGYPGAFGRHADALYVWLPLCVLFLAPFVNPRRWRSMLHLDLLVLLSLSVSLAYFNHAHIYASVPLAYPPLLYLLARALWLLRRPRAGRAEPAPLRLLVPVRVLAIGVVFLIGFRVALNVIDSNVVDVGYAGVIGADRIADGRPLYGSWPADNEHGDTYGPVNYEVYVPFEQIFGWSGTWDDLPAAHAAAIFFDLLAIGLLFLLGRRMRGPTLGVVLAYAWVSYPFTLFTLDSNSNDTLVAVFVLLALLASSCAKSALSAARGAISALAGLTKFAPLALTPLLLLDALRKQPARRRPLAYACFFLAFALAAALAMVPALAHDSLHEIYERTFVYQANRGSPFSVWGLYGWHGAEAIAEVAAVVLALVIAVAPRRMDLVGLSAACAAIMIGVELTLEHWFYLYIPWFLPALLLALFGRYGGSLSPAPGEASAVARSSRPEAVLSS
jgi:hypothetical protein